MGGDYFIVPVIPERDGNRWGLSRGALPLIKAKPLTPPSVTEQLGTNHSVECINGILTEVHRCRLTLLQAFAVPRGEVLAKTFILKPFSKQFYFEKRR